MKHEIIFVPSGRGPAQCAANPHYPDGIVINAAPAGIGRVCTVDLPYPAPECGWFEIDCQECDCRIAITAAGRADDPKRVTFPCGKANLNGVG